MQGIVLLVLLIYDIILLFSLAFGWIQPLTKWFGDDVLTYMVYVLLGSIPIIGVIIYTPEYPVNISNSKQVARDIADELEKRKKEGNDEQ